MSLPFREQLTLTLIEKAVIGLLLLIGGFWLNSMLDRFRAQQTESIEQLKSQLVRELDVDRERRAAMADFAKTMSTGYQEMMWLTWIAKENPSEFSEPDLNAYDEKMRAYYPQLAAAQVVAVAVAPSKSTEIRAAVNEMTTLESSLTQRCNAWRQAIKSKKDADEKLKLIGDENPKIFAKHEGFLLRLESIATPTR